MFFKSIFAYQLPEGFILNPIDLESALEAAPLLPLTKANPQGSGAVATHEDRMCISVENFSVWTFGTESWILPASVVKAFLEEKFKEYKLRNGYEPGRKVKRDMKDDAIVNLRTDPFKKRRSTRVIYDVKRNRLLVDARSAGASEDALGFLQKLLGGLPCTPILTNDIPLSMIMTRWITTQTVGCNFSLNQSFVLESPTKEGTKISYKTYDENARDVQDHLAEGMTAASVAVQWADTLRLTVKPTGQLAGVKYIGMDEPASSDADNFRNELLVGATFMSKMVDDFLAAVTGKAA